MNYEPAVTDCLDYSNARGSAAAGAFKQTTTCDKERVMSVKRSASPSSNLPVTKATVGPSPNRPVLMFASLAHTGGNTATAAMITLRITPEFAGGVTAKLSTNWSLYAQGGYQFAAGEPNNGIRRDCVTGDVGMRYNW